MNSKVEYLYGLLDYYTKIGSEEFINSKISALINTNSCIFCVKCCKTYIPKVTCSAKYDGRKIILKCLNCGELSEKGF